MYVYNKIGDLRSSTCINAIIIHVHHLYGDAFGSCYYTSCVSGGCMIRIDLGKSPFDHCLWIHHTKVGYMITSCQQSQHFPYG